MNIKTRVKICGITRLEDAKIAVELGADALGFICYEGSPRFIAPESVRQITRRLPPFVNPVAVMVNATVSQIEEYMVASGCRVVQLHGSIPLSVASLPYPVIRALSVASADDLPALAELGDAAAVLLDTKVDGMHGGTGKAFDWSLACQARSYGLPLILAGGLTPENIREAIRIVQPYAVDISSGVESAPGIKDPQRLRSLFMVLTT